ncbi:hypothetical protein PFUM301597_00880 [Pseudomonas fluorescens]
MGNTGLPGQLRAQHLGVDEETDQPFDFTAVTVGNRHANPYVALPGVAMQQHIEGAQQQHEQGDVMLLRAAAQLRSQARVDREIMPRALVAGHRRARAVRRQLQHRMFITKTRLPVFQLTRLLACLQPATLPQRIVAVLDRQRRQLRRLIARVGVIATDEFVDQYIHRPTVGDDVVQGQQQHVFLRVELEQLHTQQRTVLQIEGQQRLTRCRLVDGLLALIGGQAAEVQRFDGQRRRYRHLSQASIGLALEHRAQGFMPRHQAGERLLQRPQVEFTL